MSYDVFISHVAGDRAIAETACDAIERAGHLCWLAPRDCAAGEEAEKAGFAAMGRCKVFLLILSAESRDSGQVAREAERASRAGLEIIALRKEAVEPGDELHYQIAGAAVLDALSAHLDHLTATVGRILDGGEGAPMRPLTVPPGPQKLRRPTRSWLPIAIAGAVGLAAIAVVAAMVAAR